MTPGTPRSVVVTLMKEFTEIIIYKDTIILLTPAFKVLFLQLVCHIHVPVILRSSRVSCDRCIIFLCEIVNPSLLLTLDSHESI